MASSRLAAYLVPAVLGCFLTGCKPAAAPKAALDQTPAEPSLQAPAGTRRPPTTAELANFVRAGLPPVLRLVDLKNDPPTPLPNTPPGSNAWLYSVRLTFAPVEDELGAPTPHDSQAFQAPVDELNGLVAWSAAYAQSPYASLYPGFSVDPPAPAAPQLLTVLHPKDRPRPPIYAKMSAEWQVDHWQFSMEDAALPADEGGKFRSEFSGPILIQGEPATDRFVTSAKAAIAQAKGKKDALEAAYEADLLRATRPGLLYRGQVSLGSAAIPAEVRFVEPPTTDPLLARLEVRLPGAPGYLFTYNARLAGELPIHPAPVAGGDGSATMSGDAGPVPKADLTVGLEHAAGKEIVANTLPNQLLMALTHYSPPTALSLSLRHGHLEGRIATETGPFRLSAQQVP